MDANVHNSGLCSTFEYCRILSPMYINMSVHSDVIMLIMMSGL